MTRKDRKRAIRLARKTLQAITLEQLADRSLDDMRAQYASDYSEEVIEEAFLGTFEAWAVLAQTNAMRLLQCAMEREE